MIETASLFSKQITLPILKKKVCAKLLVERKFIGIVEEKPTSDCNYEEDLTGQGTTPEQRRCVYT